MTTDTVITSVVHKAVVYHTDFQLLWITFCRFARLVSCDKIKQKNILINSHLYILKYFKNATLDPMSVRILTIIDNEIVKSYQLTCIRCKNENVLSYSCRDFEIILE